MERTRPIFSARGIIAAVLALLALVSCGVWFYRTQEQAVREAAIEKLTLIGRIKAAEIANWRRGLLADAAVLAEGPFLTAGVKAYLNEPTTAHAEPLLTRFRAIQKHYRYSDIQPIPDSSWFMVAKQDTAEIFADWHLHGRLILLMLAAVGTSVMVLGAGAWQRTQKSYETLFQRMLSGFAEHEIICNKAGEPVDYRFLDVNPAFERMTGHARKDIVGKTVLQVLPETERQWIETYGKVALTGESIRLTNYSQEMDKYFFVSAFRSGPRRFATIFQDVTEHRRAEIARDEMRAQLLQAQKIESVGQLAGGVAHDFNNMLSVILGNAELALETLPPQAPQRNELQEIMKAGQRAADVTRQLLTFARKQIISPRVLDINETIEGMLKMLRSLIGENIDLTWTSGAGIEPIKIDPSQLNQILANLCLNARDAITDVGRITIETAMETLDEEYCAARMEITPGDYVVLTISDDGYGMSSETLKHLFEPFFTTKPVGLGTGLGLATLHGIVKQNHGFITVYSEPGYGTTFKIYLPPHAGAHEAGEIASKTVVPPGAGEMILIVEDDLAILGLTGVMLETLGYTVLLAQAPDEALKIATTYRGVIDLLITDVVMPIMNGRELARRLTELRPGIKSLFMSGYTADVIAHHGVLEKGVAFIQKPFTKQELALQVRQALKG